MVLRCCRVGESDINEQSVCGLSFGCCFEILSTCELRPNPCVLVSTWVDSVGSRLGQFAKFFIRKDLMRYNFFGAIYFTFSLYEWNIIITASTLYLVVCVKA